MLASKATIPKADMGCKCKVISQNYINPGATAQPNFPIKLVAPKPIDLTVAG